MTSMNDKDYDTRSRYNQQATGSLSGLEEVVTDSLSAVAEEAFQ